MPTGVYRVRDGWGTEDSVCVEYEDGTRLEVGELLYRARDQPPPIPAPNLEQ